MTRLLRLVGSTTFSLLMIGCVSNPALHVIGVYEGQTPPGVDDRPWWAKCNDEFVDEKSNTFPKLVRPPSGISSRAPTLECAHKYSGVHAEKEVTINITYDTKPIVLALTAYEPTLWKISQRTEVKIVKVILAGYHAQRIEGISPEAAIEVYTYDESPCARCWQGGQHFYSYKAPPKQLEEITGLEVTSFQGRYSGSEFWIFPGIKQYE